MAQNYTDSSRAVLRSVGGQDYAFVPTYLRKRDPITPAASPDIKPKEQQGHYPVSSLWTNTVNQNVWVLAGIVNNLGKWVLITNGGVGPLLMITGDDGVPVTPSVTGVVNLQGLVVANATHAKAVFTESPLANTEKIDIQVAAAIATTNIANVGLAAFNNTEFTVDANGFVSLIGGGASLEEITGNDGNAVVPTAGNINLLGAVVANGTDPAALYVKKTATSTETIDIQLAAANATSVVTTAGIASFDSAIFLVDANGFVTTKTVNKPGASNLGIAETAGTTFTVESASGAALSATNPAYVTLQTLAAPGLTKTYTVTANESFTQAGLGNNLFGLTTGIAFAGDIPFFLYAVSNANAGENTVVFMISRFPNATFSPIAAKIGQAGNTNATTQGSFFSLAAITAASYAASPCLCLGSFRMQYTGSLWTISAFNVSDGIGEFQDVNTFFSLPSQFGAATNSFFYANGGTAPIFGSQAIQYSISRSGIIQLQTAFNGASTAGVGAVTLLMALPLAAAGSSTIGSGFFNNTANVFVTSESILTSNTNQLGSLLNQAAPGLVQNGTIALNSSMALTVVYKPVYS